MFETFSFTKQQIKTYYTSAIKDRDIANTSDIPEVIFTFSYNALIKLSITICAQKNLRVKSRVGHHRELIKKLADFLGDKEIEVIGNEMRNKRNRELYEGGMIVTEKEAREYQEWIQSVFQKSTTLFVF